MTPESAKERLVSGNSGLCRERVADVLIVDDHEFNIEALGRLLKSQNKLSLDRAYNGEQAIEQVRKTSLHCRS